MSKERELLKKVLATGWLDHTLSCEVEAILTQPEQEAINFDLDRMKGAIESPISDVTVEDLIDKVKSNRVFYQEGYAKAELDLKREPLTDENVCEILLKKEWKGFVQLVRIIEKEHGITGVDDE